MKKVIALLTLITIALNFTACKEDEPPKSKVGFEVAETEFKESDGTFAAFHPIIGAQYGQTTAGRNITIEVSLDRAVAETSVISLTVAGSASDVTTANEVADYQFVSDDSNLIIEKGEDSAEITLTIFEDAQFEIDANDNLFETIEITLATVVSGTAVLDTEANKVTVKILEDDALIFLDWDGGDGTRGDVDMDTFLFLDGESVSGSASTGSDYEGFNIPASFPNGSYGLSFTYYSGTSDDLEFYSIMYNLGGTLNGSTYNSLDGDPLEFVGNYDQDNINEYDSPDGIEPIVVQTMTKSGFNYSNISQINEPASGSRLGMSGHSMNLKAIPAKLSQGQIKRMLSRRK